MYFRSPSYLRLPLAALAPAARPPSGYQSKTNTLDSSKYVAIRPGALMIQDRSRALSTLGPLVFNQGIRKAADHP